MIKHLVKIKYTYCYVDDPEGNYEDILYVEQEEYKFLVGNTGRKPLNDLVKNYLEEDDLSKTLKAVTDVERLGGRLYIAGDIE